jgi:hypothetical protein
MNFPSLPTLPNLPGFLSPVNEFLPAPPPFLPIPKKFVIDSEGLGEWKAYGVEGNELVDLGSVYGADEDEALEAAENKGKGNGYLAFKVVEA